MRKQLFIRTSVAALAAAALIAGVQVAAQGPLAIDKAKITIAGTSNIHDYTATTADARVTRVQVSPSVIGPAFWDEVQKPGALEAFDLTIAAATLKSSKEGLDKNMYKALKTKEHPQLTFSLKRMEGEPGALRAIGMLQIAGVEKEVAFDLKAAANASTITVIGEVPLLMTDYGITPPKAMLGMLKTDPKITVTFEVVLGAPTTFTR